MHLQISFHLTVTKYPAHPALILLTAFWNILLLLYEQRHYFKWIITQAVQMIQTESQTNMGHFADPFILFIVKNCLKWVPHSQINLKISTLPCYLINILVLYFTNVKLTASQSAHNTGCQIISVFSRIYSTCNFLLEQQRDYMLHIVINIQIYCI